MRDQVFFVPQIESFQVFRTVQRSEGGSSQEIFRYLLSLAKFRGALTVYLIDCLANDCFGACLDDFISIFLEDSYSAYEFLKYILLTIVSPSTISSFLACLTDCICLLISSKLKFMSTNSSAFSILMFSLLLVSQFEVCLCSCWISILSKQCSYVGLSAFFLYFSVLLYLSLFSSKQQVYPLCFSHILGGL